MSSLYSQFLRNLVLPISLLLGIVIAFFRNPVTVYKRAKFENSLSEAIKFFIECVLLRVALTSAIIAYFLNKMPEGSEGLPVFRSLHKYFGTLALPFVELAIVVIQFSLTIVAAVPAAKFVTGGGKRKATTEQVLCVVMYFSGVTHLIVIVQCYFMFSMFALHPLGEGLDKFSDFNTPFSLFFGLLFFLFFIVNVQRLTSAAGGRMLVSGLIWLATSYFFLVIYAFLVVNLFGETLSEYFRSEIENLF